jgi:hypothetical protein
MNKEQQELLEEAYKNYLKNFTPPKCPPNLDVQPDYYEPMYKEVFIYGIKTDNEFAKTWGLKIEERELSFKERRDLSYEYAIKNNAIPLCIDAYGEKGIPKYMETINNTGWNIPTKLITITYNDKTIESYES